MMCNIALRGASSVPAVSLGLMMLLMPAHAGDPCNTPGGDTQPPSIVCPPALILECGTTVPPPNLAGVVATDNCDSPVISHAGDSEGATACPMVITRTFVAVDAAGNSASCTQTITVRDTQRPVQVEFPLDILVSCPSQAPAAVAPAMVDACDDRLSVQLQNITQFSSVNCGRTILRRWTVRDDCGNLTRATQRILTRDFTPPQINCHPVPSLTGDANGQAVLPALPFHASDNCGDAPVVTQNPPAGTLLGPGQHVVTLTATDSCGNTASCPASVVVNSPTAGILVLKSVYLGHDGGASCPGLETVWGIANTPVTYCFRVVNNGQANLSNVTISDPALGISPINIGALAAGQSLFRSIESVIVSNIVNVATVTGTPPSGDPVADSDQAEVVRTTPSIEVQSTVRDGEGGLCPGFQTAYQIISEPVTFCFKVTNTGDVQLNDVMITNVDLGISPIFLPSLAAGQSLTSRVTVAATSAINNRTQVTALPPLGAPVTDEDTSSIYGFGPDFSLRKTAYIGDDGGQGCPGSKHLAISGPTMITYCFEVRVSGEVLLFDIMLSDPMLGIYSLELGDEGDPGATFEHSAAYLVASPATNVAFASADPLDEQVYTNFTHATVGTYAPSLHVQKTIFAGHGAPTACLTATNNLAVPLKQPLTHCYEVVNTGDTWLTDVSVDDVTLGVDRSVLELVSGGFPMSPGGRSLFIYRALSQANLTNVVNTSAIAVSAEGDRIANLPLVQDADTSVLIAPIPAP